MKKISAWLPIALSVTICACDPSLDSHADAEAGPHADLAPGDGAPTRFGDGAGLPPDGGTAGGDGSVGGDGPPPPPPPYTDPGGPSVADKHPDLESLGLIDVTGYGADPTGAKDSTQAINLAIADATNGAMVAFFPAGTYLISGTIDGVFGSKDKAPRLRGSTREPAKRSVLRLAPNSPGFGDPSKPKVVVHLRRAGEKNADHYESSIQSIDVVVEGGNPGAVGLRNQGAENTHINDVRIDLTASGYCGIWGLPGSGGSTHKVTVKGGKIGLNTYDARAIVGVDHTQQLTSQPTVVASGVVLEGQTQYAIQSSPRGPFVVVGARIKTKKKGPIFRLSYRGQGDCLSAMLILVDARVEYETYDGANTLVEMDGKGRSFILENTYVRNGSHAYTEQAKLNSSGWKQIERLAFRMAGAAHTFDERPYVDGVKAQADLLYSEGPATSPPAGLVTQHVWRDDFPSFETAGSVSVKDFGARGDGTSDDTQAIQQAVDGHEIVFFPKGNYKISDTIRLKKNSKLVGVANRLSQIQAIATVAKPFGNNPDPDSNGVPMIETPDVPGGDVVLSNIHVATSSSRGAHIPVTVGHYAIKWQCNALFRAIDTDPYKPYFYHPGNAMDGYYNDTKTADNGKYPRQLAHDVLPIQWPLIYATGHAAGRYYNFWQHGDHYEEPEGRLALIEGTSRPLVFYHFHCQQQIADYFLEVRDASQVSIFGSKSEHTFGIAKLTNCDSVRYLGHSGIGAAAPDNPAGIDWFFRFEGSDNFVFGGFAPDLGWGGGGWICHHNGYACWWIGVYGEDHPLVEEHGGKTIKVGKLDSPVEYVRGTPKLKMVGTQ